MRKNTNFLATTWIAFALALVFAAMSTVSATAKPRTCGYGTFQSDGETTVGPYCH